jgi:hypothetical protein
MKYLDLFAALPLVALLGTGAARADNATYLLTLHGSGTHQLDAWECPGQICTSFAVGFTWDGIVTVVVDSTAPGTFTGTDFVSLAFAPTHGLIEGFSGHSFLTDPSVTIAGGMVTDIEAQWAGSPPASVTFAGLGVHIDRPPTHHFGSIRADAVLSPVPEPATFALLLGGLAVMGWHFGKRAA